MYSTVVPEQKASSHEPFLKLCANHSLGIYSTLILTIERISRLSILENYLQLPFYFVCVNSGVSQHFVFHSGK
jgi:hypothetical protein